MMNLHHEAQMMGIDTSRLPAHPQLGKFYRLPVIGKPKGKKDGSVKLIADGVAYLRNFITGESKTVFDDDLPTDPKALADRKRAIRNAQQQAKRELDKQYLEKAILARSIWFDQCISPDHNHPYLAKKHLKPVGIKQRYNELVIPVYSLKTGKIESLQFIDQQGNKRFLAGGKVAGNFFTGKRFDAENDKRIIISEGWATSQSLIQHWHAKGWHLTCFNAGNMPTLAKAVRQRYPQAQIILAGDNDLSGVGQVKAIESAKTINGKLSIPSFTSEERERFPKCSDWHDRFMLDLMQAKEVRYVD